MDEQNSKQQFLLGLFGGIALIAVIGLIVLGIAYATKDNDGGQNSNQANQNQNQPVVPGQANVDGVRTYSEDSNAEICKEDGKPIVYLFSTTWCPHCKWISDTFDNTVKKYIDSGDIVAYHWEVDINDDVLTTEKETAVPPSHLAIYQKFNPQGSIPTFVFGCKYYRIGNGFERENDLASEAAEFEALIQEMIK